MDSNTEIIMKEYDISSQLFKHYDNYKNSIAKFQISMQTLLLSALIVIMEHEEYILRNSMIIPAIIAFIIIVSILFFHLLIQNRKYFCDTARQMNSCRNILLHSTNFTGSNLSFESTKPSYINWISTHFLLIYLNLLSSSVIIFFLFCVRDYNIVFAISLITILTLLFLLVIILKFAGR